MPELPEVEVTRLGIAPHVEAQILENIIFRRADLRWPMPRHLSLDLQRQVLLSTARRGKYLILQFEKGSILIHLGMSGHLQILEKNLAAQKHDHVDFVFTHCVLRLTDPRRFGAVLWHPADDGEIENHPMLRNLGVEPLREGYSAEHLAKLIYEKTRQRSTSIKQILLAGEIVVGVGNIYASECLFQAKINPKTGANRIGLERYRALARAIQSILAEAIKRGGSTLKDFLGADGKAGYFQQSYFVYDRAGQACYVCQGTIRHIKQGQRASFYCVNCQK